MTRLAVTSWEYTRNAQCSTADHHPHRVYCPDPGLCCLGPSGPLLCCVDSETWPCRVKLERQDGVGSVAVEPGRVAYA